MDNFVFEQRKVIIFIFFLLIAGLGLSWIKEKSPRLADKVIYVDNSRKITANQQPGLPAREGKVVISINIASEQELCRIPGVGPVLARRIIESREKNGPFQNREDILKIKGIGPKKFEKIKDNISFNP